MRVAGGQSSPRRRRGAEYVLYVWAQAPLASAITLSPHFDRNSTFGHRASETDLACPSTQPAGRIIYSEYTSMLWLLRVEARAVLRVRRVARLEAVLDHVDEVCKESVQKERRAFFPCCQLCVLSAFKRKRPVIWILTEVVRRVVDLGAGKELLADRRQCLQTRGRSVRSAGFSSQCSLAVRPGARDPPRAPSRSARPCWTTC